MPDQIPEDVKEDRQAELMELQQEIAFDIAEEMIGREVLVMIEGKVADENAYVGENLQGCSKCRWAYLCRIRRGINVGEISHVSESLAH